MATIAILGGTGHQGSGLAQRFAAAGKHVIVGSRDREKARGIVDGWNSPGAPIEVAGNAEAVERGEIVILAVPFTTIDALLDEVRPHFRAGTVAIDVTVPVTFTSGKMAMLEVSEGSASEHVRARLPEQVGLAATFKTLPAHLLGEPSRPLDCDEFVCADSEAARNRAIALVELLEGLRAVDVGPLSRARSIEHMTALAIAINRRHKTHDARFRVVGFTESSA
jgi:8-hydroxy-5-deazaflavin:NADPH oxidoreductase